MANTLTTSDFQFAVPKKKKKLDGGESNESAENRDVEVSESHVKKSKMKKKKQASGETADSQFVTCSAVEESEMDSETGRDISIRKKKKKKQRKHSEQEDGDQLCVTAMPGEARSPPKEDNLESMDCIYESTFLKKKKKKKLDGGESNEPAENEDVEDSEIHVKKSKKKTKKASRERSDSQFVTCSAVEESELNSETGRDISICEKKKKKQRKHSEQEDGDQLCVTAMPGEARSPPKEDNLENNLESMDCIYESPPLKRKKKKKLDGGESNEPAENQHVEDSESHVKKSKTKKMKKASRGRSDSQFVTCSAVEESEMDSETGRDISIRKKKKKKQCKHSEREDGDQLCVTAMPGEARSPPKEDNLENMDCIYESPPLKRKKKKKLDGGESNEPAENWDVEDSESHVKKSKMKKKKQASRERADSQFVTCSAVEESEMDSETGRDISIREKKKKKQRKHSKQDDGDQLCVTAMPGEARSPPKEDNLENNLESMDCIYESPPLKKKKKKKKKSGEAWLPEQAEASEEFFGDTNDRMDSMNPSKQGQLDLSDTVDMQVDLSASLIPSPTVQQSNLSQEKKNGLSNAELSHHITKKKRRKRKEASKVNGLDGAGDGHSMKEGVSLILNQEQDSLFRPTTSGGTNRLQSPPSPVPVDAEEASSTRHPASEAGSLEDDGSSVVYQDLEAAIQELEEFVPHVRSLAAGTVKQLVCRDLARFKRFREKGIAVKFGQFTQKENDLLKRNIENFLQESGIESAEKLLFTHRFPEEKEAISKLKCERLFGVKIAEGIPRPWRLVYYRARKMFDPQNYNGKYTEEEKRKLKAYQAMHGNNWKKISQLMSRSSRSVAWKYSQIKDEPNYGPWSQEETKKLVHAVEKVLQAKVKRSKSTRKKADSEQPLTLTRESLYRGIPWSQIEAKVGTRHWKQCKQRWISIVTQRMSRGQTKSRGRESLHFKINLIERLYGLRVEDSSEIDWEELSDVIGNVPPSYVQSRFYKIKTQYVRSWHKKDFPEIIDYLYKKILPKLKSIYGNRKEEETSARQERRFKKVFQFSDIFADDEILLSEEEDD